MLHRLHRRVVVLVIFAGIFFTAAAASSQTMIFTVPGATDTRAFGISPSGEIVGLYAIGTANHGVDADTDGETAGRGGKPASTC